MLSETSRQAYKKVLPELPECRLKVYKSLKYLEYATNSMIAQNLGWSINRVTPRTNELRKMKLIKISHTSWCPVTKGKANYMTIERFK